MARRLFTVEDTFMIRGGGLVPIPGIAPQGEERLKVGDPILLRLPDGSSRLCSIGGLEVLMGSKPRNDVVVLLKEFSREDVPIGTEVWSVDHAKQASA